MVPRADLLGGVPGKPFCDSALNRETDSQATWAAPRPKDRLITYFASLNANGRLTHDIPWRLAQEQGPYDPDAAPQSLRGQSVARVLMAFVHGTAATRADLLEACAVGGVAEKLACAC
jgi:hypothetical protein